MSTYDKEFLSGGANGVPIVIAATASPGTTIHTATSTATQKDEIWVWFNNVDTVTRLLTIQWGGTTDPTNLITKLFPIEANSEPILLIAGLPLAGGLLLKAFGSAASIIVASGYVNRITQ